MPTTRTRPLLFLLLLCNLFLTACTPTPHPHISIITIDDRTSDCSAGFTLTPKALREALQHATRDQPDAVVLDIVNWHAASLPAQTLDLAELLAHTRERTRLVVWINDITVDSTRILFPVREWHVRPSAQLLGLWTNPELTFDRDAAMKTFQQIAALAPNKPDCLIVYSCTPHPTTRCPLAANRDWDRFNATEFVRSGYALSVVRDESDLLARLNLPPKTRIDREATQILDQVARAESTVYDQLWERARAIELGSRPMTQIQSDPSAWVATCNRILANIAEIRQINRPDLFVYAFSREEILDRYQLDSNDPALLDNLELVVLQRRQHWESKLHRLNTGQ